YWGAYAASKAALETMVTTWAGEVTQRVAFCNPEASRLLAWRPEAARGRPVGDLVPELPCEAGGWAAATGRTPAGDAVPL
ncbi:hypothetical protein G7L43_23305, partial [Shigella sonnei]|uniref:PAS domain-containing protein n=1 Tax=Shigella sonnei TaxID=624 RepID=UPI001C12AEB7|nr:hypothetical protein [Shigella sonnei]